MKNLLTSLLDLFYPHTCDGCGTDLTRTEKVLCLRCLRRLPITGYQHQQHNPVEKIFWGRVNIRHAMSAYYYRKSSLLQQLIYQFKYKQREDIATHLGQQMGNILLQSRWLYEINCIIPVPIHPTKLQQRGYNQAALLANGIATVTGKPVIEKILFRSNYSPSQTNKGRLLRWQNVSGVFSIERTNQLKDQHILLVDDVLTTGATLEACSSLLINAGATVSICTLAFAHH
ncbi:ComF family protein [Chitinophaga filiformis]|uniref:ComF family protein n=1 Tax=Chitinophaga filiformis TaxID=104663 RepID=A0A1G7JSR9_CHIFI|nr:ComF family protein [Chitinophaga filiformis]SDF27946.1 comF family protein [Chitinophaga filiformis]